jgi:hypothetical protein
MFVSQEMVLEADFPAARAGLAELARGGWLREASGQAYAAGLTGLARVGPFGDVLGASKLVRVSLLEPVPREDTVVLPLRWEATGVMGRLFPVLDANLVLAPDGDGRTRLVFTGAYRPPLAGLGSGIDRVVLRRAASATVRSLMRGLARMIVKPQEQSAAVAATAAEGTAGAAPPPRDARAAGGTR